MKNNLILLLIAGLLFAAAATTIAKQGDNEFSIFGNYIGLKAHGTEDTFGGGVSVGRFITDEMLLGLQGFGSWSDDVDLYAAGLFLKYHFMPENQTVPYLGGQINYVSVDNSGREDGIMWGPVLGIKFGANEKTSFFIEYQYQLYDGGVGDSIDHANAIVAGFSCKF